LLGLGDVWFDSKGMVDVLSLALIEDRYEITCDSSLSLSSLCTLEMAHSSFAGFLKA